MLTVYWNITDADGVDGTEHYPKGFKIKSDKES